MLINNNDMMYYEVFLCNMKSPHHYLSMICYNGDKLVMASLPLVNIFKNFMIKVDLPEDFRRKSEGCPPEGGLPQDESCDICYEQTTQVMKCCRCSKLCCMPCFKSLQNRRVCSYCKYSLYDLIESEKKNIYDNYNTRIVYKLSRDPYASPDDRLDDDYYYM